MAEKKESEKKTTAKKSESKKSEVKKPETKVKEEVKAENAEVKEAKTEEALHPTLQKKKERREAKAARKEANAVEEKKSRPNNLLLALLIFGVLLGMFAFVGGYNYYQKSESIEKYIEESGGAEAYENVQIDAHTIANISAKGNSVSIDMTAEVEEEAEITEIKDYYGGDEGTDRLKEIAASVLYNTKPNTRAFSADATVKMTLNGEEINSVSMSYGEAKKKIKEMEKEYGTVGSDDLEVDADDIEINTDDLEAGSENVEIVTDEDGHVHEDGEEHSEEEGN